MANTTLKMKEELVHQTTNSLTSNKVQFMTGIILRDISAVGCHIQVVFQIKMHKPSTLIKVLHRPNWNYQSVKIVRYVSLIRIKLQCCDVTLCDSEPFQIQVCSSLYSVCSMYTNVCLDICDP